MNKKQLTQPPWARHRLFNGVPKARRPHRHARVQRGRRVFLHPNHLKKKAAAGRKFDVPATLAGSTSHFHVYYDTRLGQAGEKAAQGVLRKCEQDYQTLAAYFAQEKPIQSNVILTALSQAMDGTGGAYHKGSKDTNLYCDVQLSPTPNPEVSCALLVALETEVFAAMQNGGWRAGRSNGEGLSRALASSLYPNVLEALGYLASDAWLNSRRPNLVRRNLRTDRNLVGNGCAVLFLNYLHSQLGYGWDKICQAAAPTLTGTYKALTGKQRPFREFQELLGKHFPRGETVELKSDNPFPIANPPPAPSGKAGAQPEGRGTGRERPPAKPPRRSGPSWR